MSTENRNAEHSDAQLISRENWEDVQDEIVTLRRLLKQWMDAYPEGDKLMVAYENAIAAGFPK